MTKSYKLSGLTCSSCVAKVKSELLKLPSVLAADISLANQMVLLQTEQEIAFSTLKNTVQKAGNQYSISELFNIQIEQPKPEVVTVSWLTTYKPIVLIFGYIVLVTLVVQYTRGAFSLMLWMQHFMAGFFIVFSFFKLLNLKDFAASYKMYDLPAKYIPGYSWLYPFIELTLGILYLLNISPFYTNIATLIIMGASSIGVIKSVLNKEEIKCACLGAVFNLPMSTVTIIEDLLMVIMALWMLVVYH